VNQLNDYSGFKKADCNLVYNIRLATVIDTDIVGSLIFVTVLSQIAISLLVPPIPESSSVQLPKRKNLIGNTDLKKIAKANVTKPLLR
jgi:hypothetical protein